MKALSLVVLLLAAPFARAQDPAPVPADAPVRCLTKDEEDALARTLAYQQTENDILRDSLRKSTPIPPAAVITIGVGSAVVGAVVAAIIVGAVKK